MALEVAGSENRCVDVAPDCVAFPRELVGIRAGIRVPVVERG